jgi:hypothetical protein
LLTSAQCSSGDTAIFKDINNWFVFVAYPLPGVLHQVSKPVKMALAVEVAAQLALVIMKPEDLSKCVRLAIQPVRKIGIDSG